MEATKEECWKILKSKCTLAEVMKVLGSSQEVVDESMAKIGKSITAFNNISRLCTLIAYHKLVDIGEVDKTRMWNFAAQDYALPGNERHGDLGMKDLKVFHFHNDKWNLFE